MQSTSDGNEACIATVCQPGLAGTTCGTASPVSILPRTSSCSYRSLSSSDYYRQPVESQPLFSHTYYGNDHAMRTSPLGPITRRPSWHVTQSQEHANVAGSSQRRRVSTACARCRKRKIRCSGESQGGRACDSCRGAGTDADCSFFRVGSKEIPYHDIDWQEVSNRTRPMSVPIPRTFEYQSSFSDTTMYPFETRYRPILNVTGGRDYYCSSRAFSEDVHAQGPYSAFSNISLNQSTSGDHQEFALAPASFVSSAEGPFDTFTAVHTDCANPPVGNPFGMNALSSSLFQTAAIPERQLPIPYFGQPLTQSPSQYFPVQYGMSTENVLSSEGQQQQQQQQQQQLEGMGPPVPKLAASSSLPIYRRRQTSFGPDYPVTPLPSPTTTSIPANDNDLLERHEGMVCTDAGVYKPGISAYPAVSPDCTSSTSSINTYQGSSFQSRRTRQSSLNLGDDPYGDFLATSGHGGDAADFGGNLSQQSSYFSFGTRPNTSPYNMHEDTMFGLNQHQILQKESTSRFERRPSAPQLSSQGKDGSTQQRRQYNKRDGPSHRRGSRKKSH